MQPTAPRKPFAAALTALALATLASATHAQSFQVGGRLGYRHYDNVYNNLNGSPKTSDGMLSTTLFGNVDQPIGRQRAYGSASVSANRYQKADEINHVGYNAGVGLDWSTIERISGNLNANLTQSLEELGLDEDGNGTGQKSLFRTRSFGATVRVGVVTRLTAEANYTLRKLDYSLAANADRDTTQGTWGASLRYRPSPPLNLGLGLRHTRGKLNGLGQTFTRNDFDLFTGYSVAGVHNFNGRVSWSKTDYNNLSNRNIDGVTAALSWTWNITPKTSLATSYMRENGADTAFFYLSEQQVPLQYDNSQVADVLQTRLNYQATAKINAYVDARFAKRKTVSSIISIEALGRDEQRNLAFGIGWAPIRSTSLGCDIGTLARTVRSGDPATTNKASATHFGCSVQLVLQ